MDPMLIYVAIFGLVLGCVVGMTSIGNGLIGTPGLIFLGVQSSAAVGTVGLAGVFMMITSAIKHYKNKNIHMRTALIFSITAVPLSFLFARLKDRINDVIPLTSIIAVTIILAVITLGYKFFISKTKESSEPYSGKSVVWPLVLGAVMGFFIGATSISGSLIVITFMLILKIPERLSIGTANFVAIFSLAAASVGNIMGGYVDWHILIFFVPAVMIGAYTGAHLTTVIPQKLLRVVILVLLLIAAIAIFLKKDDSSLSHTADVSTADLSQVNGGLVAFE